MQGSCDWLQRHDKGAVAVAVQQSSTRGPPSPDKGNCREGAEILAQCAETGAAQVEGKAGGGAAGEYPWTLQKRGVSMAEHRF